MPNLESGCLCWGRKVKPRKGHKRTFPENVPYFVLCGDYTGVYNMSKHIQLICLC